MIKYYDDGCYEIESKDLSEDIIYHFVITNKEELNEVIKVLTNASEIWKSLGKWDGRPHIFKRKLDLNGQLSNIWIDVEFEQEKIDITKKIFYEDVGYNPKEN